MTQQQGNLPAKEYRVRTTKAAIWHNQVERDGQTVIQSSVKIQKSYQDSKTGDWNNMEMNLFPPEIPGMILILQKAYEECMLREIAGGADAPPATQ